MCSLFLNLCFTNMTRQWVAGQKSKLLSHVGVNERQFLRNVCDGIDLEDLRDKVPQSTFWATTVCMAQDWQFSNRHSSA